MTKMEKMISMAKSNMSRRVARRRQHTKTPASGGADRGGGGFRRAPVVESIKRGFDTLQGSNGRALTFQGGYVHNTTSQTAHDILADLDTKLDKSKRTGDKILARCPAHDDKNASLSVTIGDNDCVLVHCFAGCPTEDVAAALGLTMRDLFATEDAWRSHEARNIGDEKDAATREASPLPEDTPGKVRLWIDALADTDLDGQLRLFHIIAGSSEWQRLSTPLRIAVVGAINGRTESQMVKAVLGRFNQSSLTWCAPPTPPPVEDDQAGTLADLPAVEPAPVVAYMFSYRGRLGLMHGPAGDGKTTFCSLAAAAISTAADWCDRPTIPGDVLIVSEDLYTWQDVAEGAGGDLSRIHTCRWRDLEARARALRPVAIVVDTLQYVATQVDSPELDSANAVDNILVPLKALARELFCGVTVLDHEPWAEGANGAGTKSRPRHSGAKVATADLLMRCTATKDGFGGWIETITVKPSSNKGGRRGISASPVTVTVDGEITKAPTGGGGGGADPLTPSAPHPLDEKIVEYLMANPGGSTQKAVRRAVRGERVDRLVARLKAVGTLGADKLWRRATDAPSPPPEQAVPDSQYKGVGNSGTGGAVPAVPVNGNLGGTGTGTGSHPIGNRLREPVPGTASGSRLWEQVVEAKGDDAARHEKSCPRCLGGGLDAFGLPCDWRQASHQLAARFRLGPPMFSAKVGIIPAQTNTTQSPSP